MALHKAGHGKISIFQYTIYKLSLASLDTASVHHYYHVSQSNGTDLSDWQENTKNLLTFLSILEETVMHT